MLHPSSSTLASASHYQPRLWPPDPRPHSQDAARQNKTTMPSDLLYYLYFEDDDCFFGLTNTKHPRWDRGSSDVRTGASSSKGG
ncbi:hypothetical protein VTN31DRAFT_853 [Thermomyces dupontii]|uniref:uncharacterized protein n=1 Tax=Talaromyces thermophilus TaxID=28565 RepID=UPI003744AD4C